MADEVPNLRLGHFETIKMLASLLAPLIAVGTLVWSAAKYPDRAEFKELTKDVYEMRLNYAVKVKVDEAVVKELERHGKLLEKLADEKVKRGK